MKLLVEKVEVEKINGSRKDIKLNIYFNFFDDLYLRKQVQLKKSQSVNLL